MSLDEKISLKAYDPRWPELFRIESECIRESLGPAVLGIEHVGGTAVPGMTTKPVVDMLVGTESLELADGTLEKMTLLGYENLGEAGVPGRIYFRKRGKGQHFNAHFVVRDSENWTRNLLVRDYLRTHPAEAAAYADLKRGILDSGVDTLIAYNDRKRPWMDALKARARKWAEASMSAGRSVDNR